MYKIEISRFAFDEIEESKKYYNLQKSDFGLDFKGDVFNAINNIASYPNLYPIIDVDIRRCLLHRFPFSIFYTIKQDTVVILTVAHQHRKPNYWADRIK